MNEEYTNKSERSATTGSDTIGSLTPPSEKLSPESMVYLIKTVEEVNRSISEIKNGAVRLKVNNFLIRFVIILTQELMNRSNPGRPEPLRLNIENDEAGIEWNFRVCNIGFTFTHDRTSWFYVIPSDTSIAANSGISEEIDYDAMIIMMIRIVLGITS
jgi:hypothetical protein